MNDFQMSSLAADRFGAYRAAADRQQMAAAAKPQRKLSRAQDSHQPRRFGLGALLRRAAV